MNEFEERELVKDLTTWFGQLKTRREPYEDVWKQITEFVLPRRALFDWVKSERGKSRTSTIYDGTAQAALMLLADGLQGYLTSPSTSWFNLSFEQGDLMRTQGARMWLQNTEEILYSIFQKSNFYESMSELFLDGGSVGTATMYVEDESEEGLIHFLSRHPKEIYLAENEFGRVDTVFRKFYLTNRSALKIFGEDKFEDNELKTMRDSPYEDELYIHAVYPRDDRDKAKIDKKNKPFASYYFKEGGKKILMDGGYDTLPYVIWRWRTNTEEEYGMSPAWDALSDIIRSQHMAKTLTQVAQLQVEPPLNYPAELQGMIQIRPRGMNPYQDPQRQVFPMNIGGNYPVGRDREQALQQAIREHFRVDFFLMLSQMQGKQLTATQVVEMQGEKAAVLGAVVGRINTELLDPIFDRVFDIAWRAGWLPPLPPELQKAAGGGIKIDYIGPLAQAQRRYYSTQGVNLALQQLLPLVQFFPQLTDRINADELGKHILVSNGVPEKIIQDDKIVAQIRQAKAQQMQQAQQMAQAQQAADMMEKVGDKINPEMMQEAGMQQPQLPGA